MSQKDADYPPAAVSVTEGAELGRTVRPSIVAKPLHTDYPLIDSDPHISRVIKYARPADWLEAGVLTAIAPASMRAVEHFSPTGVSKRSFASIMRLSGFIGLAAGFLTLYAKSSHRFYGFSENRREIDMDMREMVDKVKKGEPLYGRSTLSEYMQGVAARNSRYTGVWLHVMPWFNLVNHPHHGVDTAKYYRQAELELEQEKVGQ